MAFSKMSFIMWSSRPSNSPVGTIPHLAEGRHLRVFPAFQFPSWYNMLFEDAVAAYVFPAFQFPSWYNGLRGKRRERRVFPAFQFPSWYNWP